MSKPITETCWCCKGAGRLTLDNKYLDTYRTLVSIGPTYASLLAERMGIKGNAMSNRLAVMARKGLVEVVPAPEGAKTGRGNTKVFYRAIPQPE